MTPLPGTGDILAFWFAGLADSEDPAALGERYRLWFGADADFDRECQTRFTSTIEHALAGGLDTWAATPRGRLALVLVLDQLTRNVFRGTARAFAGDARALALTSEAIDDGHDRALTSIERVFLYMPLQHAEDREVQRRAVEVFGHLAATASASLRPMLDSTTDFAREHRAIVERFGRFPHRNPVLGRSPTAAEREYLDGGGKRYGQG